MRRCLFLLFRNILVLEHLDPRLHGAQLPPEPLQQGPVACTRRSVRLQNDQPVRQPLAAIFRQTLLLFINLTLVSSHVICNFAVNLLHQLLPFLAHMVLCVGKKPGCDLQFVLSDVLRDRLLDLLSFKLTEGLDSKARLHSVRALQIEQLIAVHLVDYREHALQDTLTQAVIQESALHNTVVRVGTHSVVRRDLFTVSRGQLGR
mmetsp:Transcript_27999/g.73871  ORF Transcript_27999/g.73871 Transcript_27999/m.73871 type:complete len:204 (+) Transcript_27999:889-1500(+)